jgi:hypothetical protein
MIIATIQVAVSLAGNGWSACDFPSRARHGLNIFHSSRLGIMLLDYQT